MGVRRVRRELEARLAGGGGGVFSGPSGRLERKSYDDLTERLKISLRNLNSPDEADATVTADGSEIARVPVHRGVGRLDVESRDPGAIPDLAPGQLIEVRLEGIMDLSGELHED